MYQFQKNVFINCPQEEAFSYVTDLSNDAKWQNSIESVEKTSDGPIGVGSTWQYKVKFLGRQINTQIEMTSYEQPNRARVEAVSGPVPFENTMTFESKDGGTQLSISGQADIGGFFKLAEGLVGKQFDKQMESDLKSLKAVLEEG